MLSKVNWYVVLGMAVVGLLLMIWVQGASAATAVIGPEAYYQWSNSTITTTGDTSVLNTKGCRYIQAMVSDYGTKGATATVRWLLTDSSTLLTAEALVLDGTAVTVKSEKAIVRLAMTGTATGAVYAQ